MAATKNRDASVYGMEDDPVSIENIRRGVANGWNTCVLTRINNIPAVPNIFHILGIIAIGIVLMLFIGCRTQQLPTIPNSSDRSHDSIRTEYVHDSVYIDRWHKEIQKGDTFYIHDSIDRWRDRYIRIYDSIDNSRIDTIYKAVEIEKKGSAFLRNSGIVLWVIIALIIAGMVIGIILKCAK